MLRIKELAKQKGMSMEEMADKLGINRVSLSRNINGNPTVETLNKIAYVLGVNIRDLFAYDSESSISGFVKVNGQIYEVANVEDLEAILSKVKE